MTLIKKLTCWTPSNREDQRMQRYKDRVLAEALQRSEFEEARERQRSARRDERRMWYEYYLTPFTTVVKESDLFYAHPKEDSSLLDDKIEEGKDSEDEDIGDDDTSIALRSSHLIACEKSDTNAALHLRLESTPTSPSRCVGGTCACCLEEYKAGDEVVYSDLQCQHVFHKECMMQWLSKGKKRCPMCRHWFVPGSRIEDQQKSAGAAWRQTGKECQTATEPQSPTSFACVPCKDMEGSESSE